MYQESFPATIPVEVDQVEVDWRDKWQMAHLAKELLLPPNQDLLLFIFIWAVSTSKDNRVSQMLEPHQHHF